MARKGYTPEQIIRKLREAEVFIAVGMTAVETARKFGVIEQTSRRETVGQTGILNHSTVSCVMKC